jgi:single-strand DNA-binding protein
MRVARGAFSFSGRRAASQAVSPILRRRFSSEKLMSCFIAGSTGPVSRPTFGNLRALRELPTVGRAYSTGGGMEEIDFNPMAANTISIIGNVGRKPELKFLESGSKVTNFPVAFTDRKEGDTQWFDVEAWDELADMATAYIDKGERVALQGRLKVQDWTDREGNTRKSLRIVAQAIQRVRRSSMTGDTQTQQPYQQQKHQQQQNIPAPHPYAQDQQQPSVPMPSQPPRDTSYQPADMPMTNEELWMSFFENTSGWYDNREKKVNGEINPKSPDFKRIEGGREAPALWIDSKTTPAWVRSELAKLDQFQSDIPPF